ncbi:MAG TPA: UDP-N-acetylmuramoyl-tripeptide--D-alanyl-D-alanine ligase [Solirubrobacterales bacterium]|nr:UDP-N-acetylmuramoyl-tripeptide--D-alanyl-D-alanine ligase [Solirubrobacterales bacterium]
MIEMPAERMAAAMGAEIIGRGPGGFPALASIDSREIAGHELFFGLIGANDDGGRFAAKALEDGAWGVVVGPDWKDELSGAEGWIFVADDPLLSLQMLARAWRRELGATVIGITGSVGKTSVKDITRSLLPGTVHASRENFNTEIGLPLTILAAPAGTETLVLEMAMRGAGQIRELTEIAEPDIGVITNVGPVHVELLGSIEAVAAAKAELIGGIVPGGTLVVPVEAGYLEPHLGELPGLVRFGSGGDIDAVEIRPAERGTAVVVSTGAGTEEFEFPFTESHNVTNALAAIGAGLASGATLGELSVRTSSIKFSALRGEHIELEPGVLVVNDCYNANPLSMRAALEYLGGLEDRPRKIAVLGLMAELGPDQDRFHREIGEFARDSGIDLLIAVGPVAEGYGPDHTVDSPEAAAELLGSLLSPGDAVLVKGSRSAGLEAVAARLIVDASDTGTVA